MVRVQIGRHHPAENFIIWLVRCQKKDPNGSGAWESVVNGGVGHCELSMRCCGEVGGCTRSRLQVGGNVVPRDPRPRPRPFRPFALGILPWRWSQSRDPTLLSNTTWKVPAPVLFCLGLTLIDRGEGWLLATIPSSVTPKVVQWYPLESDGHPSTGAPYSRMTI